VLKIAEKPGDVDRQLTHFFLQSFTHPLTEVVLASLHGGQPISISRGGGSSDPVRLRRDRLAREALADTLSLDQVFADDFQATYCIGPAEFFTRPGDHPAARLVARLLASGKPVAVISSGRGLGLMITGASQILAADALLGTLR
jgi:hypothetical protein